MGLAILAVIVLLYIGLAYFAARTWQTGQVVLVVLLFIMALVGSMFTAATMKVQQRWRGNYNNLVKQIDSATTENTRLRQGSVVDGTMGVNQMQGEVSRLLVDRGRVWRNLRLANLGEGQLIFDTGGWTAAGCRGGDDAGGADEEDEYESDEEPVDDPDAEAEGDGEAGDAAPAPAGAKPSLEINSVVFAFKEAPLSGLPEATQTALLGDEELTADGCMVPYLYMGEYRVVEGQNLPERALVLEPTIELSPQQVEQLNQPNASWVLYEVMPTDAHDAFAGRTAEQLSAMIAAGNMDAAAYRTLIQEYARDLQRAEGTDPPERQWVKIEFTQPHSETVDVNVAEDDTSGPLADAVYDANGRAQVATLIQGVASEFQEGDVAVFDYETANRLVNVDGKAKELEKIYTRQLRDYPRYFRGYQASINSVKRQIAAANDDIARLESSIEKLQSRIAFQRSQAADLQFDIDGLGKERQILGQYTAALDAKWNELRAELSRLYRTNRELVRAR